MAGYPRSTASRCGTGSTESLTREPGQVEISEAGMQANIESGDVLLRPGQERRDDPQDDMISRLIAAEIPREDGEMRQARRHRDRRLRNRFWAARAPRPSPSWSAARWSCSPRTPTSGRSCSTTAARSRPRSRSCCATRPRAVQRALLARRTSHLHGTHHPRGQAGVPDGRLGEPRSDAPSPTPTRSTSTATAPRRRTSAWATAFTAASAPRWPAWRARSRWSKLLDFMPRYEVDFDRLQARPHAECRRLAPRPGEGVAMKQGRSRLRPV